MSVALVTGGARGLGREICLSLGRAGFSVAVNYLSSEKEAGETARSSGRMSAALQADVGDPRAISRMISGIEDRFGRLDVVINNAGTTRDDLLLRQSEADWDNTIRTNLTGSFNVIRLAAPFMARSGGGHIVNISSYSGVKGKPGQSAYSASKAGLIGLTKGAAIELAEYNIRVNAVLPGYMAAGMGAKAEGAMEAARRESLLAALSEPAEVAELILCILRTRNITGQVFSLESRIL